MIYLSTLNMLACWQIKHSDSKAVWKKWPIWIDSGEVLVPADKSCFQMYKTCFQKCALPAHHFLHNSNYGANSHESGRK